MVDKFAGQLHKYEESLFFLMGLNLCYGETDSAA